MRSLFTLLDRAVVWLTRALVLMASVLLMMLAIVGTLDVATGNLFDRPLPAATEFASALLPITVFAAMAFAQQRGAHIEVDLFAAFFSPRVKRAARLLALFVGLLVFAGLSHGAWVLAIESIALDERAVAAIQFPVWPSKLGFAVGATVCLLEILRQIVRQIVGLDNSGEP